jgi:hypothetical protein
MKPSNAAALQGGVAMSYDLFISHASEDKESFVRPLAVALRSLGVSVWYDDFSLELGDSLSRSIDKGIAGSRYGLVVVSHAFMAKRWTEYELRGLVNREIEQDAKIIPVWHGVTKQEVLQFSPSLADKIAIDTARSDAQDVALKILREVRPDLYKKHPRAELARIASGEAMAELQEELEGVKQELAEFQCPFCGCPFVETARVEHEYGDDFWRIFECGYEDDGHRPCPSDPKFPKLDEYELSFYERSGYWTCLALPLTPMAKRLGVLSGEGQTKEEAELSTLEQYEHRARRWPRQ